MFTVYCALAGLLTGAIVSALRWAPNNGTYFIWALSALVGACVARAIISYQEVSVWLS